MRPLLNILETSSMFAVTGGEFFTFTPNGQNLWNTHLGQSS